MTAHGDGFFVSKKASGAITGYRFVMAVAAGLLSQATGPRANIVGCTGQNGADDAAMCDYLIPGQVVALVEFGGTVTAGQPVTSDATGKAVLAKKGDRIGGYAHVDAVSGDLAGVILALSGTKGPRTIKALPAFVAADSGPLAADMNDGAIFTIPQTAANSTITIPNPAAPNALDDGIEVTFFADGDLNDHTITYRDGDGTVVLTAAATLNKRHTARAIKVSGKWQVDLSVQA